MKNLRKEIVNENKDKYTANEKDISIEALNLFRIQSKTLEKQFKSRRINFYSCKTIEDAQKKIKKLILLFKRKGSITKVGFADSVTLHQLDVFSIVSKIYGLEIIDPMKRKPDGKYEVFGKLPSGKLNLPKDKYYALMEILFDKMRESIMTDIFIIGANAITMKGQIISTDGTGNRVSGMIFGPKKVIILVGKNKITKTIEEAFNRNRNIAAPLNFLRHNLKHHNRFDMPCLKLGYCTDCRAERRACLNTVIIDGAMEAFKDRFHLILVNENLGF